jgi:hypothetical protein
MGFATKTVPQILALHPQKPRHNAAAAFVTSVSCKYGHKGDDDPTPTLRENLQL